MNKPMSNQSPGLVLDCLIAFHTVTPLSSRVEEMNKSSVCRGEKGTYAQRTGAAWERSNPSGMGVRWRMKETAYLFQEMCVEVSKEQQYCQRETSRSLLERSVNRVTRSLGLGASGLLSLTANFAVETRVGCVWVISIFGREGFSRKRRTNPTT